MIKRATLLMAFLLTSVLVTAQEATAPPADQAGTTTTAQGDSEGSGRKPLPADAECE